MRFDTKDQQDLTIALANAAARSGTVQGADLDSLNRLTALCRLAAAAEGAEVQEVLDAAAERKAAADDKLLAVADQAAKDAVRAERKRVRRKAERDALPAPAPVAFSGDGADVPAIVG